MSTGHPSCYHTGYALNCAEYDDLLRRARGQCMLCKVPSKLNIDHDHQLGAWAVRGLVCPLCNQALRYTDAGTAPVSPVIADYLARAWHLTQPSSTAKQARVKPRVPCPTCGHTVGLNKNRSVHRHTGRTKPYLGDYCPGGRLPAEPDGP
jgi:hypothetical protein